MPHAEKTIGSIILGGLGLFFIIVSAPVDATIVGIPAGIALDIIGAGFILAGIAMYTGKEVKVPGLPK